MLAKRAHCYPLAPPPPPGGTADGEMKDTPPPPPPPWWEPRAIRRLLVGQNIALHAVLADKVSASLVSAFPIHSTSFSPTSPILNTGIM